MYLKIKNFMEKHFFLIVFICLALWYVINNFNPLIKNFQDGSEALVKSAVIYSKQHNFDSGGFMYFSPGTKRATDKSVVYKSQFGLQYNLILLFAPNKHIEYYLQAVRILFGVILAFLLALYLNLLKKEFNLFVGFFSFMCILGSIWITKFSVNLYWITFTMFAPFIFSAKTYRYFKQKNNLIAFYSGIAFLIFIKSLCGYEYLTNITLSTFIPVLYYDYKSESLAKIIKKLIILFMSCVMGFLVALLFHIGKGYLFYGSFLDPVKHILWRASIRSSTTEALGLISECTGSILKGIIKAFLIYSSESVMFFMSQVSILILGIIAVSFHRLIENRLCMNYILLILTSSFLATISWGVFAFNHNIIHTHMNSILFFIPFNLILFPYLAYAGQKIYFKLRGNT